MLLSAYVDVFDVSVAKFFVGVGAGPALVKEKITFTTTSPVAFSTSVSTKKTYNVAYMVAVGASTEFAPGVKGDLTYSWRDYGKTKNPKGINATGGKTAYKGHNVTVGVRFDI